MMVRDPQNGSQRRFPAHSRFYRGLCAASLLLAPLLTHATAESGAGVARSAAPPSASQDQATGGEAARDGASHGSQQVERMGPTEGERHLSIAGYFISAGELTQDEDARRAAYEKAREHAERAVELMPDSAEAHFLVFGSEGRLAQMDGLATAALKLAALNSQLDEVLRLDPNHANALAARGGMMMKLPRLLGGNSEKGLAYLERAVSLDDESVGKRLELAEVYHMLGRENDARRVADEALAAAEKREIPEEVVNCKRFITELAAACPGCELASAGD